MSDREDPRRDLGDDEQEWELEEIEATGDYGEEYVDYVIDETSDDGVFTIDEAVRAEDHGRRPRDEDEDDDESAEQAAIHVEGEGGGR